MSAPAAARFTPEEIAEAVAKRVARVGDFDDNVEHPFAQHGIELTGNGFMLTRDGQTFHLAVTQVPSPVRAVDGVLLLLRCGRCKDPVGPLGAAPPFCAACIDRCHEATEFDHTCPVCQHAAVVAKQAEEAGRG